MEVIRDQQLPAVRLIKPKRFEDDRGYFCEIWRDDSGRDAGFPSFVQDNQSLSTLTGTIRGLHFQIAPHAQAKLVRCVRGRILDVAVDIRHGSPTFGQHVAYELSAENGQQLFVPVGFAHGFCTLEPNCEVTYKVSAYYDPACDKGLRFDDPALGIAWGAAIDKAVLSPKDRTHPTLEQLPSYYSYLDFPD